MHFALFKLFRNGFQLTNNNASTNNGNLTQNTSFGLTQTTTRKQPMSPELMKLNPQQQTQQHTTTNAILPREVSDQIGLIMKKIGNSETSKDGIHELYDFKQQNPDIDLNKYFKNSSGKLQSYIQENLRLIEIERNSNGGNRNGHSTALPNQTTTFLKQNFMRNSPEKSSNCRTFFF